MISFRLKYMQIYAFFSLEKSTRKILQRREISGDVYKRGALILNIPSTHRYYFFIVSRCYRGGEIMVGCVIPSVTSLCLEK